MIERAKLQTDGGARGNPGPAGAGFQIEADGEIICSGGWYLGETTNNVAEYQAMIWGLENAQALNVKHLDIRADSQLVVKQLLGEYKVKNEGLKPLHAQALSLVNSFSSHTLQHVYREDNSVADAMANKAMDAREPVGDYKVELGPKDLFGGVY